MLLKLHIKELTLQLTNVVLVLGSLHKSIRMYINHQ